MTQKPRPVQTPKSRSDPPRRQRRPPTIVIILAAIGITAYVSLWLVLKRGGEEEEAATAGASAKCKAQAFPDQGNEHVTALPKGYEYRSAPATSGSHDPVPAVWGSYTKQIEEIKLVHNLEHGGIVVQYGTRISPDARQRIEGWYRDDPYGIVIASQPKLGNKVAATAWTKLSTCIGFDEEAISRFREAYRAKGPERFPLDALAPGT